jgi:hypothetical protein
MSETPRTKQAIWVTAFQAHILKCAKGRWLLDEQDIPTGNTGAKICVIMESASTGQVLRQDSKIVERDIGRI